MPRLSFVPRSVLGVLAFSALVFAAVGTAVAAPEDQQLSPEMMDTIRLAGPYFQQELGAMGFVNLALYALITVAGATLFAWWVSGWFNSNRASLPNALRLVGWWGGFALFGLGGGLLLFRLGFAVGAVAFGLIMLVVGGFSSPMKVYELTVTKAAGFLVCWVFLNTVVQVVAGGLLTEGKGMPWTRLSGKSTSERLAYMRRELDRKEGVSQAKPEANPSAAAATAPSSSGPDLHAMYEALQKDRVALDMNDREAVAAFNARAAEYKALVAANAASTAPAAPASSASPASGTPVPE